MIRVLCLTVLNMTRQPSSHYRVISDEGTTGLLIDATAAVVDENEPMFSPNKEADLFVIHYLQKFSTTPQTNEWAGYDSVVRDTRTSFSAICTTQLISALTHRFPICKRMYIIHSIKPIFILLFKKFSIFAVQI